MANKRITRIREHVSSTPSFIFIQFFLILLIITVLILFTSVSFYRSIIESATAFSLRDSLTELQNTNTATDRINEEILQIEKDYSVIIEIYGKSSENDEDFTVPVYTQYSTRYYFEDTSKIQHTLPVIDFHYPVFNENRVREINETTKAGKYVNPTDSLDYFVMTSESEKEPLLYVIAIRYSQIESQAATISIAVSFILIITFIIISLVAYLFITRVTKPLRDIRDVTKAMVETSDTTLRIPTHERSIITETDETISSVNYLYENLIFTQERLKEKTEVLANQLQERDLEQKAREEFIAGTSHEFKTPIAIIQGYAEGAKYLKDDPQALDEYCDTIIEECVRMTNLVVNMMSLSNLQQTKLLNFRDFSIRDFVAERFRLLEKTFEKKGIRFENLITEDIWGKGDPDKLHFVVNNLISNAVSYIDGEDKIIRVRYEEMELVYRIYVFNSGNHIPQPELEKLWEAFYRNDPARNRNEGHFGLGLSIIKSVQDAHSQACGVDNTEGGVEFWFDILK